MKEIKITITAKEVESLYKKTKRIIKELKKDTKLIKAKEMRFQHKLLINEYEQIQKKIENNNITIEEAAKIYCFYKYCL